jgi:hypothetical protein
MASFTTTFPALYTLAFCRTCGTMYRLRSRRIRLGTRPSPTSVRPTQGVARLHNPTHSTPETTWISTGCREIQALPSYGEGDPTKKGEIQAKTGRYPPFSHVGALYAGRRTKRRPSHGRTTRPNQPPKPLGSRPDVARSKPSRATARGILQYRARSDRRRVGTRPSPTSVRYTQGQAVARPHNPSNLVDV